MATWPATLPDKFLRDGLSEDPPDLAYRSKPMAGPDLLRGKVSADVTKISGRQLMTTAQVATLDDFYVTTLENGTAKFAWTHPRTEASVSMRLRGRPGYTPAAPGYWYVALNVEVLP